MYVSCRWAREEMGRLRTKHKMTFDFNPGGGEFSGQQGRCQITTCDDVTDLVTFNRWLIELGLEKHRTIEIPYNPGSVYNSTLNDLEGRGLVFEIINPSDEDSAKGVVPYFQFKYRDTTYKISGKMSPSLILTVENWMNEVDVISDQKGVL